MGKIRKIFVHLRACGGPKGSGRGGVGDCLGALSPLRGWAFRC